MKKILSLVLVFIFALSLTACGEDNNDKNETKEKTITIEEYKNQVLKFVTNTEASGIILSNMAQYENNYWSTLESYGGSINSQEDYDKILSKTYEWVKEKQPDLNQETITNDYNKICSEYKNILLCVTEDSKEKTEIESEFKELFNAYNSIYLLVTSPSGDLNTFVNNYNTYNDTFKSSKSNLDILLQK